MEKLGMTMALVLAAGMLLGGCKGRTSNGTEGEDGAAVTETELGGNTAQEIKGEGPEQRLLFQELAGNFKVEGKPCVQSFVEALPVYSKEYGWCNDPEIDNRNGFFHYGEEGAGGVFYYGCIWKRDDGSRLFIFSYKESGWNEYKGVTERFTRHGGSPWYYSSTEVWMAGENEDIPSCLEEDTGFAAYTFNEATSTLEMLPEPPFNGWQAKDAHRFLVLPQKGKDIAVQEGVFGDFVSSTLKWNGMTFDL